MTRLGLEQLLAVAREAYLCGDFEQSRTFYEQAVRKAEMFFGMDNPAVGLILLDVMEVYDQIGDATAVERAFDRIKVMLQNHSSPELSRKFRQRQQRNRGP